MKAVVPVAGIGSRLKPHTHTTPKPLMDVAGKAILERVIEDCLTLNPDEIIFVVGYRKESIIKYVHEYHPDLNCRFVEQKKMDGDGAAIRLALEDIEDDTDLYVVFGSDTLIDFDLKDAIMSAGDYDAIIIANEVEAPQNYGILNVNEKNEVYEVEEKPKNPKSNLAIIGAYYFKSLQRVKKLLNYFYENKETVKDEYRLVQVIENYVADDDLKVKAVSIKEYYDCGRIDKILDANRYFLGRDYTHKVYKYKDSIVVSPSYIDESAVISNSIIGPFASIGKGCVVRNSIIENSIVNIDSKLDNIALNGSFVGKHTTVHGKKSRINIGDNSEIFFN